MRGVVVKNGRIQSPAPLVPFHPSSSQPPPPLAHGARRPLVLRVRPAPRRGHSAKFLKRDNPQYNATLTQEPPRYADSHLPSFSSIHSSFTPPFFLFSFLFYTVFRPSPPPPSFTSAISAFHDTTDIIRRREREKKFRQLLPEGIRGGWKRPFGGGRRRGRRIVIGSPRCLIPCV